MYVEVCVGKGVCRKGFSDVGDRFSGYIFGGEVFVVDCGEIGGSLMFEIRIR